MFLTQEKLAAYTLELKDKRYQEKINLFPFNSQDVDNKKDDIIVEYPGKLRGEQQVYKDMFFTGRDRYLWIQTEVVIPEKKEGCQIIGVFDFGKTGDGVNSGFESLLYIDGKPYQGVDNYHREVVLDAFAGNSVELTFLLWTGLEGGGVPTDQTHRFREAGIGYVDINTDYFYYYADAIVKCVPLMPEANTKGQKLINILNEAFYLIDWDQEYFYTTAASALKSLEWNLKQMPKKSDITVHCVGHTHIDVAWLWRLKHTREKAIRSFSTALRLMEQNDDFLFLQSQPQLYQYIKEDCPEIYEQIKKKICEGKWEADGGMWLEADCNITSGEALARQFLHGCNFMKEEFDHECTHLWLPDVFGYSWALPQILKQCGIKTFATTKISWNDVNRMPHDLFWWRGIDGSKVLTYFITTPYETSNFKNGATYNGMLNPFEIFGSWDKFRDKNLTNDVMIPFGYGDGGGGVTTDMLKRRRSMNVLPGVPNVVNDTAGAYFEKIHQDIKREKKWQPVWDGELYLEYHRGTYTSQAKNKKWNRKIELKLAETEWLASCAMIMGKRYPWEILHHVWEIVLRNQFHDIIPGSSIHEVYEDSLKEYMMADALLDESLTTILSVLSEDSETNWTLWNFSSNSRNDLAHIKEMRNGSFQELSGKHIKSYRGDCGYWIQLQMNGLEIRTICFIPDEEAQSATVTANINHDEVQTPFYKIKWNKNGQLVSIYDKSNEREVLKGEGNRLEVFEDKPLRFDAWDIDIFHMEKSETANLMKEPQLIENNELRSVIRFSYSYRKSAITQDLILYAESRRIDFKTTVDWNEKNRLLKAAFDLDIRSTKASYDIQFGHVERPTHFNTSWDYARFEVVGHKWADISDSNYGVSLLNDCKYGYSARDNTLRISLLKSAKYPDPEADMGKHTFTYALFPHTGTVTEGGTIPESMNLNLPIGSVKGRGKCTEKQLLWLDNPSIIIDAVKKAEKEECLVIRVHEAAGSRQHLSIESDYHIEKWAVCNILEREDDFKEGEITMTLRPFEIVTLKIWMMA